MTKAEIAVVVARMRRDQEDEDRRESAAMEELRSRGLLGAFENRKQWIADVEEVLRKYGIPVPTGRCRRAYRSKQKAPKNRHKKR